MKQLDFVTLERLEDELLDYLESELFYAKLPLISDGRPSISQIFDCLRRKETFRRDFRYKLQRLLEEVLS